METENTTIEPTDEQLRERMSAARAKAGLTTEPTGTKPSVESDHPEAEDPDPPVRTASCRCGSTFTQARRLGLWVPTTCETCIESARREVDEWDERRRREEIDGRMRAAGLPLRYREREARLDTFTVSSDRDRQALQACLDLLDAPQGKTMLLTGGVGTGKTHLGAATLAEWIIRRKTGRFTTHQDLLLHIRSSYRNDSSETELEIIDEYRRARLLVLDDLGAEKASVHSVSTLFAIVNYRDEEALPTILTSNFDPKRLADHLSLDKADRLQAERILDRVVSAGTWIELAGPSHRRS